MAIGVRRREAKPVITPRGERGLQRVVIGYVEVRHYVDVLQVWKLLVIWTVALELAVSAGDLGGTQRIERIDVPIGSQIVAVIANVIHFQGVVLGQSALNAKRISLHPGWNNVPTHGIDAARRWVRNTPHREAIAARKPRRRANLARREDRTCQSPVEVVASATTR